MKKRIIYTIITLLVSSPIFAQNYVDALRYSNYRISGTARSAAMGNAFGALGADFTSLSINPAGIAVYRSSEFEVTPGVGWLNMESNYLNNNASDIKHNFSLNSIGYVASFNVDNSSSSLVNFNLGVGFNKLANFNQNYLIEGYKSTNSLLDAIVRFANREMINVSTINSADNPYSNPTDYWETEMAYNTYLLDLQENSQNQYMSNFYDGDIFDQRRTIFKEGGIDEFLLSLGANFNHMIYVGGSFGIHDVRYDETINHSEYNVTPNFSQQDIYIDNFTEQQWLNTTGNGYNFKLGIVIKPIDALRLGVAFHSPTFYDLHDTYNYRMVSLTDQETSRESTPTGEYDYHLETPIRAIGSAALVIGKKGLISADYEWVNYSKAKLRKGGGGYDFTSENNGINDLYKSVGNIHVGAEYRITDNFSLRGGYEYYPSPYRSFAFNANQPNSKNDYTAYSGGIGYRQNGLFIDVAYKHTMDTENTTMFDNADVLNKINNDLLIFTLGFKF